MKRLLPLIALVSLMSLVAFGYIAYLQTIGGHQVEADIYNPDYRGPITPMLAIMPVTPTIIAPGQSVKVLLTPQPISGNAALILEFQVLNEWGQLHNADIFVNGQLHGHNLAEGEIQLPGEGQGVILEFVADGFKPISYTMNYRTKSRQRQPLTVQLQPQ